MDAEDDKENIWLVVTLSTAQYDAPALRVYSNYEDAKKAEISDDEYIWDIVSINITDYPASVGFRAEEALDYEGVEDQAVMFDIINMVEANDLWNEVVFELIARGDAIRRADGKIIFTDQAPQYDIIEDIAEYTSPQFDFNADGDIK